jgi:hydroxymethylbilane synthase
MAAAALERLGLAPEVIDILEPHVMLPQVGQGAIAVECRVDDDRTIAALEPADHAPTRAALMAERAFLARLGGGCELPVGAYATPAGEGRLRLEAMMASLDGRTVLRSGTTGGVATGASLGASLADELLGAGGRSLLGQA